MNLKQLQNIAKLYGCRVDTDHSSGFVGAADVWAFHGSKKERIGFSNNLGSLTTQELIPILERVSGRKIRELWTGGKGGTV